MTRRSWTEVADGVLVAHSRLYATTTTIVRDEDGAALLVDPSWTPDELADTAADLVELGVRVTAGFATHAHHDHVLWHPDLGDVPRYASGDTVALAARERQSNLDALGPAFGPDLLALVGRLSVRDSGFRPGLELVTHDAHSAGHTALWWPERGVLLAGDMLSDREIPLAAETGLAAYRVGLDLLLPAVRRARVLVPGHGSPTDDPMARWDADDAYLTALLHGRDSGDPRMQHPETGSDNRSAHRAQLSLLDG